MTEPTWKMPEWMEPYREMINNTGGNGIEDLMNDHSTNSLSNAIRSTIIISVDSQVRLLCALHKAGKI